MRISRVIDAHRFLRGDLFIKVPLFSKKNAYPYDRVFMAFRFFVSIPKCIHLTSRVLDEKLGALYFNPEMHTPYSRVPEKLGTLYYNSEMCTPYKQSP